MSNLKKFLKVAARDMKKARGNPGPHECPPVKGDTSPAKTFMHVPEHLQGYVLRHLSLKRKGRRTRSCMLQEVFWAVMRGLSEWQKKAPRDARYYQVRADWAVVAIFDDGDQD